MNYVVRPCQTLEELAACVTLQKQIWGYADREVYPLRLFVNLSKIGGHVLGAFAPGGQPVGFVASMPAWHGRRRYFHSLSLGVLPAHENQGLGRRLKLEQRKAALGAGIDCVEWTFDPLRPKAAFFNIVRLGAISRRYLPDCYGLVESRLQGGLPSDRLLAEWRLKSARVRRALGGGTPRARRKKPDAEVPIPGDIDRIVEACPAEARARQLALRKELQECFARKLVITDFAQDRKGSYYLLDKYED